VYADDCVVVGVIRRAHDLRAAQAERWYRVPLWHAAPTVVDAVYLAFYLSGRDAQRQSPAGGVYWFARVRGYELHRRCDLLPQEKAHPRANDLYLRFALDPLQAKAPPIFNPTRRTITFIRTTWDRFRAATVIADLYSEDEAFVRRD